MEIFVGRARKTCFCLFVCFALSLHMRNSLFIPVPKYSRPIIDARHLRVD